MAINNPFASQYGLGARISDEGPLSHFRWYDPLLVAGTGPLSQFIIGGREAGEALMKDAELPQTVDHAVGKAKKAPDFTDAMVQLAARAERDRISGKQGRRSTFVTGQSASSTFLGSY